MEAIMAVFPNSTPLPKISRRSVLVGVGGSLAAVASSTNNPSAAIASPPSEQERVGLIQQHLEALADLLRQQLPGDHYDRMQIFTGFQIGADGRTAGTKALHAVTLQKTWEADARIKGGGFFAEYERDNLWINLEGRVLSMGRADQRPVAVQS
jgi:hypothetical protein